MYSDALMDLLARVLTRVVAEGEGSWREKAAAVRDAMDRRDASGDLVEFAGWFQE